MPFTITMPKLSPTMEEGTIVKWHAKEGDEVASGAVLIEVATDKATVEYNALDGGFLRKILIAENASAKVNQPIAIFTETKDESIEGYQPEGVGEAPKEEKKEEGKPTEGEKPKSEAPPPPAAGMQQPAFTPEPPLTDYEFPFASEAKDYVPASPLAKKLAKEKGLDISTVKGSGPQNRVVSSDLDLSQPDAVVAFGRREMPTTPPGTFEEVPLSPMRKAIGKRLQESKTFIPHFYVHQDVDVTNMVAVRNELKEMGIKITFNDFVLRAVALGLKEHPEINSGFNSVTNSIILFKTVDISVGVSVDGGLITPIIRHADYKNIGQISTEMKQLAKKAKAGKLTEEEYKGGSFTVSNLGMFGVSDFVAVINPPQSSILAIGGIEEKPAVFQGTIQPRKIMRITIASDHRVVDGADAARFIKTVQKFLESPSILLI